MLPELGLHIPNFLLEMFILLTASKALLLATLIPPTGCIGSFLQSTQSVARQAKFLSVSYQLSGGFHPDPTYADHLQVLSPFDCLDGAAESVEPCLMTADYVRLRGESAFVVRQAICQAEEIVVVELLGGPRMLRERRNVLELLEAGVALGLLELVVTHESAVLGCGSCALLVESFCCFVCCVAGGF